MGSHELVARVLATADKRGIYADTSIYGAGLLDLQNALTPQGETRMLAGQKLNAAASFAPGESILTPPKALGDVARRNLLSAPLAVFDEMNAPFPLSAENMIAEESRPKVSRHLRRLQRGGDSSANNAARFEWGDHATGWAALSAQWDSIFASDFGADFSDAFGNPFAALAGPGMAAGVARGNFRAAAFGGNFSDSAANQIRGFAAESALWRAPDSSGGLAGQMGFVAESDSILGGRGFGAFGGTQARTMFWGARGFRKLGGAWNVRGAAYWGRTDSDSKSADSWRLGADNLRSASFAAGLERTGVIRTGDALGFWLSQPLRAESGAMTFARPTGRTKYGELTYRNERWTARPSGRELQFALTYRRTWGDLGFARAAAEAVRNPGHQRDAPMLGRILFLAEREF